MACRNAENSRAIRLAERTIVECDYRSSPNYS
jgi:hypothetical protein